MDSQVRKEVNVGQLTVSRVFTNMHQKEGTLTAELRQAVETKSFYPSKQIANDMQDNVFAVDDFGFGEQEFSNTENRVSWIDVPAGTTVEQVTAKLAANPDAGLYRVLSNHPILTSGQVYAINNQITTKEAIAESQVVRMPEGSPTPGALAPDPNGKPQYRGIFFSIDGKDDNDKRTSDVEDFFTTELISSEIAGSSVEENVESGQTITM